MDDEIDLIHDDVEWILKRLDAAEGQAVACEPDHP
jgi:hypothetical protein